MLERGGGKGLRLSAGNRTTEAVVFLLLSGFCFSLMGLFVSLSGDLPVLQKSFFRNAIATCFASGVLFQGREARRVGKGNRLTLLFRASFGTLGLVCNFYALSHLPLADATMLNKLAPFSTLLFSVLFLREHLPLRRFLLVGIAFAGSLFVVKPTFQNVNLGASLVAAAGGILAGAAYALLRKLQQGGVNGRFIVFFFSAFSSLVLLPFVLLQYRPMGALQCLYLLLAGLCAAGGQFSITAAYKRAPAREISVYDYTQVFFSLLLGLCVFGTLPDGWSLIGYAVILTVAVVNFRWTRKSDCNH